MKRDSISGLEKRWILVGLSFFCMAVIIHSLTVSIETLFNRDTILLLVSLMIGVIFLRLSVQLIIAKEINKLSMKFEKESGNKEDNIFPSKVQDMRSMATHAKILAFNTSVQALKSHDNSTELCHISEEIENLADKLTLITDEWDYKLKVEEE